MSDLDYASKHFNPIIDVTIVPIPKMGYVVMKFASRLDAIAMSPDKAREIASQLLRLADEVEQTTIRRRSI